MPNAAELPPIRRIAVLGMHRSGTSAVTGALCRAGCWFARPDESIGASAQNAKGFFERRDVRQLNDALLAAAGARWDDLAGFDCARIPGAARATFRAAAAPLVAALDARGTWVVKEPRLCLLLPEWLAVLGRPAVVLVHRNPLDVADSLGRRNGFTLPFSLALWEAYNVAALAATRELPRIVVAFDELLTDPRAALARWTDALTSLGVTGLSVPADAGLADLTAFVDRDLVHHRHDAEALREVLTLPQLALHERLCTGGDGRSTLPELSLGARRVLAEAAAERRRANELAAAARALAGQLEAARPRGVAAGAAASAGAAVDPGGAADPPSRAPAAPRPARSAPASAPASTPAPAPARAPRPAPTPPPALGPAVPVLDAAATTRLLARTRSVYRTQNLLARRWAPHRFAHVVAAFEDAVQRGPIASVLSAGCGRGLPELQLAALYPKVAFVLSDHDPGRTRQAAALARRQRLRNVSFERLDILDEPDRVFDFVMTVEVLEHIADDRRAARHLAALSRRFVYTLVPFCSEADLEDEALRRRVLEQHEHERPGYTRRTLLELFADATPLWMRNTYYPDAASLRAELTGLSDEALCAREDELMRRALADVRDEPAATRREAAGIELLVRVRAPGTAP